LQYVDDISFRELAFANNTFNPEGGMHVTGFKTALTRAINNYAKKNKLAKEGEAFTGDDVLEGITAVVSVKMPEIQFEGQTKAKLGSPEARTAVEGIFSDSLSDYLEEHPEDARAVINKVNSKMETSVKDVYAAGDCCCVKSLVNGKEWPSLLANNDSRMYS